MNYFIIFIIEIEQQPHNRHGFLQHSKTDQIIISIPEMQRRNKLLS